MEWRYMTVRFSTQDLNGDVPREQPLAKFADHHQRFLDAKGLEGWEMVGMTTLHNGSLLMAFKRQGPGPEPEQPGPGSGIEIGFLSERRQAN
jgi:hypothetical protein